MKALVFDKSKSDWETSRGFEMVDVPEPVLDEKNNPADTDNIIMKVHYAGVCGTDKGIWNRQAFGEAILNSIDEQNVAEAIGLQKKRLMGAPTASSGTNFLER